MKTIITVFMIVLLVLVAVACGATEDPADTAGQRPTEPARTPAEQAADHRSEQSVAGR